MYLTYGTLVQQRHLLTESLYFAQYNTTQEACCSSNKSVVVVGGTTEQSKRTFKTELLPFSSFWTFIVWNALLPGVCLNGLHSRLYRLLLLRVCIRVLLDRWSCPCYVCVLPWWPAGPLSPGRAGDSAPPEHPLPAGSETNLERGVKEPYTDTQQKHTHFP